MESCGMSCIKYLLFAFNLIFAISGIAIIIAGAVVLTDIGEFSHFMENRILAPPIVLIVVGSIIFIVAFLGCFGAIRESFTLLMAFAVCLLIIFIVELAVGIVAAVHKNDFETALKDTLKKSMKNFSITNSEDQAAWNNVQTKLKCCGVEGVDDWPQAQLNVPRSCCYSEQEEHEQKSNICTSNNAGLDYIYKTGCYDRLQEKVHSKANILIGVGIGIAFIQIAGIILACCLGFTIRKEDGGK